MRTTPPRHPWQFKARFRRHAFGWRSQPAITRVKEAVAEIRKVARKDALLAAEGAVTFLERVSPALEQVDSSSGAIGTAVRHAIESLVPVIAAAFQAAVVDVLVAKAVRAVQEYGMDLLVVSGGVASNTALREALRERAAQEHIRLVIPQRKYCTDNAAMVGVASIRHFRDGQHAGLDMNAVSRWSSITGLH